MENVSPLFQSLLGWEIGDGANIDFFFLYDNWTVFGPLSQFVNHDIPRGTLVKSFIHNGTWDICGDSFTPSPDPLDLFTIKSANNYLIRLESEHPHLPWERLWHLKVFPRIKFFLWLGLHDRVPTTLMLFKKRILRSPFCSLCQSEGLATCFILLSCFPPTLKRRTLVSCVWQPPPSGFIVLNTDGALQRTLGLAGFGYIIRDHQGSFITAGAGFLGRASNNVAELMAIREGLRLVDCLHFPCVIIQTDSQFAIHANCRFQDQVQQQVPVLGPHRSLLEDIHILLQGFQDYRLTFVYRESNQAADRLATFGCSLATSDVISTSPSDGVVSYFVDYGLLGIVWDYVPPWLVHVLISDRNNSTDPGWIILYL